MYRRMFAAVAAMMQGVMPASDARLRKIRTHEPLRYFSHVSGVSVPLYQCRADLAAWRAKWPHRADNGARRYDQIERDRKRRRKGQ